jgi:hypothetical protein
MNKLPLPRALPVGLLLAALIAATRSHHFASALHLPDASWAVFFLAGALLPGWRWRRRWITWRSASAASARFA